ncbi:hypothetical protein SVAN01_04335 [Stagonosporopsis vannaccii]|nr:hypothetical protein SVAN01_04335 [Stagonosporopsis vannaccii]
MPAETACPVSGVDRALSAYINSRDDTLRIRRTLSRYLVSSLRPVAQATQEQHVNHECPYSISAASTNPPGLKGSRADYLHALRKKSQAESKHQELQASLEELRNRYVDENPTLPQSDKDDESTRGYINLLRQRRKLAEFNVIQESLEKLLCAKPSSQHHDPRVQVQEVIGEQPDLPAENLEQISQPRDDQSSMFALKQEVLEARSQMDQANSARQQAINSARDPYGLREQVHALEKARNVMVEWMHGELAKMEEDSVFLEDASPIKRSTQESAPLDIDSAEARVRDSYDRYTLARVKLITTYESLTEPLSDNGTIESNDSLKSPSLTESSTETKLVRPITKLLPHLPHFARSAHNERSLLEQVVYLEGQLAASDQELGEALLRLSGESHLLPARSKDASTWGTVATEAERATVSLVRDRLRESHHEVSSIDAVADLCSLQSKVLTAA